jgi:hypothetical protein
MRESAAARLNRRRSSQELFDLVLVLLRWQADVRHFGLNAGLVDDACRALVLEGNDEAT